MPSYLTLQWRARSSLDDSLDVVAAHGVGGTVGALLTGVFAQKALNGLADGALFGNPGQLMVQATAVLAAAVYSGIMSFILLKLICSCCRSAPPSRRGRAWTSARTAKRPTCTPTAAAVGACGDAGAPRSAAWRRFGRRTK